MVRPAVLIALSCLSLAQQPSPQQPSPAAPAPQDLMIKLNVDLIQVDVTVTDKSGKRVPGLTADDFEVFREGKRQPIKKVLYVSRPESPAASPAAAAPVAPEAPAAAPRTLITNKDGIAAKDVRRTIAIFIDDLSVGMESMFYMRDALKKFIGANIREGDVVAVYRSSGGLGLFQQFSNDKRMLLASVDKMRLRNINGVDSLAPINTNPQEENPNPTIAQMAIEQRQRDEINARQRQDMVTSNVLSTAAFVISGLREFPGRKSMVIFSESLQLSDAPQGFTDSRINPMIPGSMGGSRDMTRRAMESLIQVANRTGVTFYTIDPRGLQVLGFTAQDQPSINPRRMQGQAMERVMNFQASQEGMSVLAKETGGLFFHDTNDLTRALAEAASDLDGYYLIAFQPDAETFEKTKRGDPRMQRLEIKVKRSGMRVRYRKSFIGLTDAEATPAQNNPMAVAMTSPFKATGVPFKLTPLYVESEKDGPFIRALILFDANALQFSDEPAAPDDKDQTPWKKAVVNQMLVLYDQHGAVADRMATSQNVRLRKGGYDWVMKNGLSQMVDIPIKKPGAYQVRAAVMDGVTKLTGSASQFVEVPDIRNKQLAMSDVAVYTESFLNAQSAHGAPALRVVNPGESITYRGYVYNVSVPPAEKGLPHVEIQSVLYRDGKVVYTSQKTTYRPSDYKGGEPLVVTGTLSLGPRIAPGEYVLQVAVRDVEAPKKHQFALRTVDFEVRPKE